MQNIYQPKRMMNFSRLSNLAGHPWDYHPQCHPSKTHLPMRRSNRLSSTRETASASANTKARKNKIEITGGAGNGHLPFSTEPCVRFCKLSPIGKISVSP